MLAYISCSFSCLCMLCKCLPNLWLACDLLCLLRWFACQFSCVHLCVAWIYICVVLWSYGIWSYMTMVLTMVYKNHLYNHQICYRYHKEININCMWIGSWRQLRQVYFSFFFFFFGIFFLWRLAKWLCRVVRTYQSGHTINAGEQGGKQVDLGYFLGIFFSTPGEI